MKSKVSIFLTILNLFVLITFWIVIQLDIKFSFGPEKDPYIFEKGQELGFKTSLFIGILLIINIILFLFSFFSNKKKIETHKVD